MDLDALNKLKEKLEVPQNSVIVTHRNPDGDTMGSILGMFWFLKSMGLNSFTTSKH
jgi:phosphoesterase RecJ-like protein|tara:strand:- start:1859 stop:2026 length:168 start_codon:yes stop_codon:yes gene_type:complete